MYNDFYTQIQSDELAAFYDGSFSWDDIEPDYPHDLERQEFDSFLNL